MAVDIVACPATIPPQLLKRLPKPESLVRTGTRKGIECDALIRERVANQVRSSSPIPGGSRFSSALEAAAN